MSPRRNTTQAVAVRRAQADDAEPVSVLCAQLGYPSSPDQVRQRLSEILADPDHVVLVAEMLGGHAPEAHRGRVVGWVQIHVRKLVVADRHAEVVGLVVDEAHRRHNVGRSLLGAAEAWALAKACASIRLRSNVVRIEADRFYRNLGYHVVKTQRAYRKALSVVAGGESSHA